MSNVDETRWVIQIRRTLEEELEEEEEIPVCIFNVPKTLMCSKPEVYVPQQVALGPYHYWRQELYEMERYKLAAAKRTQKRLHSLKFQHLVDQLIKLEPRIRCCYHKYLDFNGETLAWMMAIDTSFLLEYLQIYKQGKSLIRVSSRMSHLVDFTGRKSAHNAVLRDIVMLENQIPLFVVRKVLEFEHNSLEIAGKLLCSMLKGLCQELAPLSIHDFPLIELSEITHLLEFIYLSIVPKCEVPHQIMEEDENTKKEDLLSKSGYIKQFIDEMWKILCENLKLLARFLCTFLSKFPCCAMITVPIEHLCFNQDKEEEKPEDLTKANRPPLVEEIMIPSVTELSRAGVRFIRSDGDIKSISFDTKTYAFYLPTVCLDVNTEVVLRNLVAYEASTASGPLVFTRYTELMNGIIDTEEDVKLLREKGIVLNYMKSDGEVADIWNGMSKSIKLTRVPNLDKVIEDLNKFYSARWRIKIRNFVRTYVFGSWKVLVFLAAVFLLLLMTLQAFCSVFACARFLRIGNRVASP